MLRNHIFQSALVIAICMSVDVSQAAEPVSVTTDVAAITETFCAADRSTQHVFVVPAALFSGQSEIVCDHGASGLRSMEPADDPGHVVVNVDPPAGIDDGFDCDGKADIGMSLIAINCLPANLESADHTKSEN